MPRVLALALPLLLLSAASAACAPPTCDANGTAPVLSHFFSMFEAESCRDWASAFLPTGAFYHPKVPDGAEGFSELMSFCQDARGDGTVPNVWRQDGNALATLSGDACRLLVPYVWSTTPPEMNSGFESLVLVEGGVGCGWRIESATEYFSRNALAFDWTGVP
mmetsp:Transcript_13561/g.45865  ORF Transcript_13561/g.45865 Transcript_13561/m.45865 type:complete len:163 (-) Transcript_13561:11-499(-)